MFQYAKTRLIDKVTVLSSQANQLVAVEIAG